MQTQMINAVGEAMVEERWADVLAHISPHVRAHVPTVGVLEGVDALAEFLLDTTTKTNDGEHFELLDTLMGERFCALYFRITAERPGRVPLDNLTVHLARIGDGCIEEIWFHNFDTTSVAEFWA